MHTTRRMLRMLLLLLALLPAAALATSANPDDFVPMPASEYSARVPDGLAYTSRQPDGSYDLHIDVANTQWGDVMIASGSAGVLHVSYSIPHPTGAVYFMNPSTNFMTEEEVAQEWSYFEEDARRAIGQGRQPSPNFRRIDAGRSPARLYARFAAYVPELDSVSLEEQYNHDTFYIRWYDASGNTLQTRKLVQNRTNTVQGLYQVAAPKAFDDSRLMGDLDHTGMWDWAAEDGVLIYTPKAVTSGMLRVGVKAPANATQWRFSGDPDARLQSLENGYAALRRGDFPTDGTPYAKTFGVTFLDANGSVVDSGLVWLRVEKRGDIRFSTAYANDYGLHWEPVPDGSMVITNPLASAGYTMTYESGLLETDMTGNGTGLIGGSVAQVSIGIKAPAGAQSYRELAESGDDGYGKKDEGYYLNMQDFASSMPVVPVSGDTISLYACDALREFPTSDGRLSVFMPASFDSGSLAVGTSLILWYASANPTDSEAPIRIQYFNRVDRRFCVTQTTAAVSSEEALPQPLTQPVAVDPLNRGWQLQIRYYLQSGTNAILYEIKCVDRNGDWVTSLPAGEKLTVYLPYPKGQGPDDEWGYALDHYPLSLYSEDPADPVEPNMTVTRTPYGLKFEATGFSPYALRWTAPTPTATPAPTATPTPAPTVMPAPTAKPPKTGDPSAPVLWLSLTALALIGCAALCGRKRRKA